MSITIGESSDYGGSNGNEGLFEMQKLSEDTVLFNILQYMPGYMHPFKKWLREMLGGDVLKSKPCYMVIDMSRMERLSFLSYEDSYALTHAVSSDRRLKRLGIIFVMPPEERGYCLYKELIARDWVDNSDVHRTTSVAEALEWISERKRCNR